MPSVHKDNVSGVEHLSIERGCGTHRLRLAIEHLPPVEREKWAILLGDFTEMRQPLSEQEGKANG